VREFELHAHPLELKACEEIQSLRKQVVDLTAEGERLRNESMSDALEASSEKIRQLEEDLLDAQSTASADHIEELGEAHAAINTLEARIAGLEAPADIGTLEARVTELEAELASKSDEVGSLQTEINESSVSPPNPKRQRTAVGIEGNDLEVEVSYLQLRIGEKDDRCRKAKHNHKV
jgi:chromosome segregation ATPase